MNGKEKKKTDWKLEATLGEGSRAFGSCPRPAAMKANLDRKK